MKLFQTIFWVLLFTASPLCASAEMWSNTSTADKTTKILGGSQAKRGDWPWMAALLYASESNVYYAQFCGGVLIDEARVLTAAHCVDDKSSSEINVAVGAYDLASYSGSRTAVDRIRIHPQYSEATSKYDIAILELHEASAGGSIVLFAGESEEEVPSTLTGEMVTALGWGWADSNGYMYYPEKLRQVNLPVVADSFCNDAYSPPLLVSSQLCAGYYEGKDVCNGDSGGPVVAQIDNQWVHVGLTSYGAPCDSYNGWYGVYTRTSSYVDFIKQYAPGATFLSVQVDTPQPTEESTQSWMMLLLNGE